MSNNTQFTVGGAVAATIATLAVIMAVFWVGHWRGGVAVTAAERLNIQSELVYQIVNVQEAPTESLVRMSQEVCSKENSSEVDTCVNKFLTQFATVYVVNLVDGVYSQLGRVEPTRVGSPVPAAPVEAPTE